jgi:hypothetical protein
MVNVPQSASQQVVYTASHAGIMVLMFKCSTTLGNIRITRNNDRELYNAAPVAESPLLSVVMQQGDEIRHDGVACTLYGVRIGDEL